MNTLSSHHSVCAGTQAVLLSFLSNGATTRPVQDAVRAIKGFGLLPVVTHFLSSKHAVVAEKAASTLSNLCPDAVLRRQVCETTMSPQLSGLQSLRMQLNRQTQSPSPSSVGTDLYYYLASHACTVSLHGNNQQQRVRPL